MIGKRSLCRWLLIAGLPFALLASPRSAVGGDLANARLQIAGSRLKVSPESQTVPYDTPTIVETQLEGYDASRGVLPKDLRVLADFTGPEIDGVLVLETVPNQPFRIPRLRLQGEYRLDNIRLVEGEDLVAYAAPRSAAVLVTQVLITRVTSRALTLDEIRSYGIVVNDDSFQAFNFTFAFAVDGEVIDYNVPILYYGPLKEQVIGLWDLSGWRSSSSRFTPPRMAPFQLKMEPEEGTRDESNGGCEALEGDCRQDDVIPVPGVILFPTDVSLLHQFFSVVLMAQNGAPAGDPLQIHDLTAKVTLPPGLRQAKTDPPTPLGVPVPVRVPGPDGELGTGDDLTFLIAQATGQAEVLVEGLREGTHVVNFDLEGVLRGLPGGQIRRVTGKAQGAVIVRDPTLNVTITHPDTVRTDEEYKMLLTVTNTGNAPANLMTIRLPLDKLSGVEVVGENEKTVTVLPGDAELVEFQLRSKRTGRVTATAARAPSSVTPRFELTVGVGEDGIPLSPNAIILPRAADSLPPGLVRDGLNLLGLGFSLATAPASLLKPDMPQVSRAMVDQRVWQISQAGRHVRLGEDLFDSIAQLAAEWTGARDADWGWDLLRRTTRKGGKVGASFGAVFAAEAAATSPEDAFDRFVKTTGYLPVMQAALAEGDGVTLEISSRTGGQRLAGGGLAADRLRELPFADLYQLGEDARMALLAVPEEGGYRAVLRSDDGGLADLHLLVPGADGGLRVVRWRNVSLSAGGMATVEFRSADPSFTLHVDTQGDGVVDSQASPSVQTLMRRPFQAIAAVQHSEADPTGHVVEVLFTTDVDPASLRPREASRFSIPGKISNGGLIAVEQDVIDSSANTVENPFEGLRNTRVVRVIFNNPLSPYTSQMLTVSRVKNPLGEEVVATTVEVRIPEDAMEGTMVEGKVYGPDGKPVPFAEVELRESDRCLFCEEDCRTHKTAVVRADASGSFLFDYVRQTQCSDIYQLKAIDAVSGHSGTATGRVRFVGQTVRLDVLMLGRGTVRGRVTYEDGSVPAKARVIAESPVFREARAASIDGNGNFEVQDVPVGTITLSASDGQGRFVVQTIEVPAAGAVAEHNLVILRQPETPPTNGEIRGKIFRPDGTTPVAGAHVALYVNGNLIGTRRSGADGAYDFGVVPAGHGEIETFEGETGQSGVQVFFELLPDRVNVVDLVMREERGVVTGFVYRKTNGVDVPLFGAIVWAEGTPFKTVTDAQGRYTLEGVFAGTRNISVADLEKKAKLTQAVTIGAEGQIVEKNFYFQDASSTVSGIAGEVLNFDGSPVFGATVHLAAGDQHWYRTATSNSQGRFTIPDLGVGVYEVHAFKGAAGGKAVATIRFVGDTPFVTIRFKKGTIRGTVKAETAPGNLIGVTAVVTYRTTTVRLELVGLDLESHNITTDADGNFEIPDALAGPYVLTVTNSFYGSRTVRGEIVSHGDVQTHDFVFEADLAGNIRGVVLNHDGVNPVQGAQVRLRHPNYSDYDKVTDGEGKFTFELVPPISQAFPIEVTYEDGAIFRKSEVWVRYNQRGQDLDVEIVLPKQGSISGRVADSNGEVVPGSVVTLQESAYPRRRLVVNADAEGSFEFNNIFAGTVTLSARAPSLGGLGGKTTVEIKAEGEDVAGVTIFLEPTGKLAGQVKLPPVPPALEGEVVASAELRLLRNGYLFDTVNADTEGRFEFSLLPLGWYDVVAFDPRTGRFGRSGAKYLGANNQELVADVQLEARGTVNGHLYEPGTALGVPGATIQLGAQSIHGFTTYSSTGADGSFSFLGIPQGKFSLSTREPGGRRRASAKGEIVTEGETVTVDLFLDRQGTIVGSVLNPVGDPDGVFPNANTLIYQTSQIVGATLSSEYEFPGIILGETFRMRTEEVGGPHRGEISGKLSEEGPVRVDIRMRPIGAVKVDVVNSFGAPVPAAQVQLVADGFYGYKRLYGDTGTDHSVLFQDVGEGRVTAYATDPSTGLKGSATGVVSTDGEIVQVNLQLQNSAAITGVVVLADGATPAVNALAALQIGGRTLTSFTDENGAFTIPSVPLGSFLLVLQESFGPGMREIRGSLASNGQTLNLGTVVLDAANPKIVEISPVAGSVDLPLNTTVLVRFSEAMDTTRHLVGNLVVLETASGKSVAASRLWVEGNTAIRLTPSNPLLNFTTYRVRVVSKYLFDAAGRPLEQGAQISFTTADVVGPTIIEATPLNNARQVPLSAQVKLLFNEAVDTLSLAGGNLQWTDLTTGAGVTSTYLFDAPGRAATVTPVAGLMDGHRYRVTVQGVTDRVGNPMPQAYTFTFQALDMAAPVIAFTSPAEGAQLTSGERMTVSADVTDLSAVTGVSLRIGSWVRVDTAAPYSWNVPAPVVAAAGDATIEIDAVDEWGNGTVAVRAIEVEPSGNESAPQVTIQCLLTAAAAGLEIEVPFQASDDENIESYWLKVNGQTVATVPFVDDDAISAAVLWRVPADATPGQTFTLRIEARDFAGNIGFSEKTLTVEASTVLTAGQALGPSFTGQTLTLSQGTFTLSGPLSLAKLTLIRGAKLTAAAGAPVRLEVTGRLEVGCGASIDGSGLGYAGGTPSHPAGYAPAGVAESQPNSGGSHGGVGAQEGSGAAGAVFDSVYEPRLGGGGGSEFYRVDYSDRGGAGGGVVDIQAGELVVDGEILAKGGNPPGDYLGGGGAGGTVVVRAATLSGGGRIDVSGADGLRCGNVGGGGGGRAALVVQTLSGFDPAAQVRSWGGGQICTTSSSFTPIYAAPGTVYVFEAGSTYGRLLIDAGQANGVNREGPDTELPALGSGAVTALEAAGADAWLTAAAPFKTESLGAWVTLKDASGAVLGTGFQVTEIDGAGRGRLAGAGVVSGATAYAGEYRFDNVDVRHDSGLVSSSPIISQEVIFQDQVTVTGEITAGAVRVKSGAVVKPATGGSLRFRVSGTMTVEAGAVVDVTGLGYAGGTPSHPAGHAPAGVAGAQPNSGGGHGGVGAQESSGAAGAVFDSVYEPRLGGGGGSEFYRVDASDRGGAGGGVVDIQAAELVLDGEILAMGGNPPGDYLGGGGAGGTVLVRVATLSGAGKIDVSGADGLRCGNVGAGGGGRASLVVQTFSGFDPAAQVKSWGGGQICTTSTSFTPTYAAPGTVYVSEAGSTYGRLLIDAGQANGVNRQGPDTELPALGSGAVTALTAAGADAWLTAAAPLRAELLGAWVTLKDASGAALGQGFRVVEIDGAGRARLASAGTVAGAVAYVGEYRFDNVDVRHDAGLVSSSPIVGEDIVFQDQVTVSGEISAGALRVKSGAVVKPATGGTLRFRVSGTMTVEAGAVVDVSGLGYAGGTPSHPAGYAPPGVTESQPNSGGSHGGVGSRAYNGSGAGAVFDSVYEPRLGGGGGSEYSRVDLGDQGGAGGGVVDIQAGELVLDGDILATGGNPPANKLGGGGAGGTVVIRTATLSGAGRIDVSGADGVSCSNVGGGGGGRASLVAQSFSGFDPAVQVKSWGGGQICTTSTTFTPSYAAPGTVYVSDAGSTYGRLLIDSGQANGVNRQGPDTELPALGAGAVTALTAAGADAWLTPAAPLKAELLGAWVTLKDASGMALGQGFRVVEIDGSGQARLAGAGAVSGAASYTGEYRFDNVDVRHDAGLVSSSPILGEEVVLQDQVTVAGDISAGAVRVKSGAVVKPATGGTLRFRVTGTMTVEAGAVLDVSGLGYAGGIPSHPAGYAPSGVTESQPNSGGSHGGAGSRAYSGSGAGAVFDSVYEPRLGGGGGSEYSRVTYSDRGGAGGGVVDIQAGELVLDGEILAVGGNPPGTYLGGGGAGGTVLIRVATLSGGGRIDVSGADGLSCNSVGGGGGGRAALLVQALSGFDPAVQVKSWGGGQICTTSTTFTPVYAAPGTIYVSEAGSTYGRLLIDTGQANGVNRKGSETELPVLQAGAVTALTAAGTDAWMTAAAPLKADLLGAWVTLKNASGAALGQGFRVVEIDGDGRARLAGAGTISGAAAYTGEYRFDHVEVRHGASLWSASPVYGQEVILQDQVTMRGEISAGAMRVKSGALVKPGPDGALRFRVSGTMTVEPGALLDVSGLGYAGGDGSHSAGYAPPGVRASQPDSGGSHGGVGGKGYTAGVAGEVYDNVFEPGLGGGGGAEYVRFGYGDSGGAGGGVVDIQAGELALGGEIRAKGVPPPTDELGGGGAGGTVLIRAATLSGAGLVDASGGNGTNCGNPGGGGGGRVALHVETLVGFDPDAQVSAAGGFTIKCGQSVPPLIPAAPGTVYVLDAAATHGRLRVDQKMTGSVTIPETTLPGIGRGVVGAVEVDAADPADLWIQPQDPYRTFGWTVTGMWVRIGAGEYRVIGESVDRRRLLLAGAAGLVAVGDAYRGAFKLDAVSVRGGARLSFGDDEVDAGTVTVDPNSTVDYADYSAPAVQWTQPTATAFTSGDTVTMAANVSDADGLQSVVFHFGGETRAFTPQGPFQWNLTAPPVAAGTDLELRVVATDISGNVGTATRVVRIEPLAATAPPTVALSCLSAGALLPLGLGLDLQIQASDDRAIERIDLFFDEATTPAAVLRTAPYNYRVQAPADTVDGQELDLRVVVYDYSLQTAEVSIPVKAVQGTIVSANTSLAPANTSLDGASVIVAAGTLTVEGPHTFRDLVVMSGAKVTHPETTSTQAYKLELTLQRDLFVACGGSIDVTARGYIGANSSTGRAYGYGNTQAEGANPAVAGSHGGRGGKSDGSSPVYGSFYDPRDPGAGGGYHNGSGGGLDGGGVIRVTATGQALVDGSILANGESGTYGNGGAGGSIRLNAQSLKGLGTIAASGSVGGSSQAGGGGGRIALYAASVSGDLLARTFAKGGHVSSSSQAWGAAGTVFVKPDGQALGDLILDNGGVASAQYTDLPAVGRGVVDAVSADGFTDNEADFRHFLGAAEVAFGGDLGTLYAITGHAHHGTSLTLAVPAPPLSAAVEPGDTYEGLYRFNSVTVRNGAKGIALDRVISGNDPGANWTQNYAPSVQIQMTSPTDGATFTAGEALTVSATGSTLLGIKDVTFRVGSQAPSADTASPYTWTTVAPSVSQPTDFQVTATLNDLSGNRFTVSRTIHVVPLSDPNTPVVTLSGCWTRNGYVTPGAALSFPFTATDNLAVQSYALIVDGVTQQTVYTNAASVSSSFNWTAPAGAAAGTVFNVRIQATDFAGGTGYADMQLTVPQGTLTPQSLTSARNGQSLILGAGTFTVQEPLSLASLTLLSGANLVGLPGQPLTLTVAGDLRVQCGATIDVSKLGYLGGVTANSPGGAPAGVTASAIDAGGSHGGLGTLSSGAGPVGEVFGSVYEPRFGGGGGSLRAVATGRHGGNGGGVVVLDVGELVLNGSILAWGEGTASGGQSQAGGAGGSVLVLADVISGGGFIEALGGEYKAGGTGDAQKAGSGGGGRVALYVDSFVGFDPAAQIKAWGGVLKNSSATTLGYGGAGTVFVKLPSQTYGRLIVDQGTIASGKPVANTPLPVLGSGDALLVEAAGADAWVTAGAAFKPQWAGAWMALEGSGGTSLGSFRVLQLDGVRALLQGAAAATTATRYRGRYRFDQVDLRNGALASQDELELGTVTVAGESRLPKLFSASAMTVKAGAAVAPAEEGELRATVSGALTVEATGRIDVSALGYLGGVGSNAPGQAPAGVTAAQSDAGGSHGGLGVLSSGAGPIGEVFGSVYQPRFGGGGGSLRTGAVGRRGGNGGGVVALDVGELVLNGEIRALGEGRTSGGLSEAGGAGGSVLILADVMRGTGLVDVSGGQYRPDRNEDPYKAGSGGGGRVALYVDSFVGFDPALQVKAWGGVLQAANSSALSYGGPGTVFVKLPSQTYGRLIVDQGTIAAGKPVANTPLPVLGSGDVLLVEAAGADAWVTAGAAFTPQWMGAWMALDSSGGTSLGSFRVLQLDGARALLQGAAAATTAARYRGQYRFDQVDLQNGIGLISQDELELGTVTVAGGSRLPKQFSASAMTVKAGAVATPVEGGELRATVSGTLTIEATGRIDVSALGYLGGIGTNAPGQAPAGVTASASDAGGSHGGLGVLNGGTGAIGEVFGSVYEPRFGGGGGSLRTADASTNRQGGNGGGIVALNVGELVLNGEIRALGEGRVSSGVSDAGGAGGSVLVLADVMRGTGLIDVSGGQYRPDGSGDSYKAGSGGGGRVALYIDSFVGFDPVAQVKARGGSLQASNSSVQAYASPGTVFVKQPSHTHGRLIVDQGGITAGKPIPNTPLPSVGVGIIGTATADFLDPTGLWIEPADPNAKFALGVIGMWVRVGANDYRILDQSADRRRVLLQGATGSVQTGEGYRGVYKFDEIVVRGGSKLEFRDTNVVGTSTVDSTSSVIQNVP